MTQTAAARAQAAFKKIGTVRPLDKAPLTLIHLSLFTIFDVTAVLLAEK